MKKMEEVTFLYTSQPPENGHVSFANSPNNSISQNAVIVSLFEIVTQLDFLRSSPSEPAILEALGGDR
nr:hypothetical protein CFP56_51897 [Quercus suber]